FENSFRIFDLGGVVSGRGIRTDVARKGWLCSLGSYCSFDKLANLKIGLSSPVLGLDHTPHFSRYFASLEKGRIDPAVSKQMKPSSRSLNPVSFKVIKFDFPTGIQPFFTLAT